MIEAKDGFDAHVGTAFHLLIPHRGNGYTVDHTSSSQYGIALARAVINHLEIKHSELPCIVFRSQDKEYFYLKLGRKTKGEFLDIIGNIGDLAVKCAKDGPRDPLKFREYVNMHTANYLRREKLLSAISRSLPALGGLISGIVDANELV